MARIIYTAIVESIRGSIAGTTFQRNAYGYTCKKKPRMVHPNSKLQQLRKGTFSQVVKAWQSLTSAQRADYNTWASTYPQYAKHNSSAQLSGFAVFCKYNYYKILGGSSVVTSPNYSIAADQSPVYSLENNLGALKLYVSNTDGNELWECYIFISRPISPTQNFVGTKTRYIQYVTTANADFTITDAYTNIYGRVPAVGELVALDAVLIGEDFPIIKARTSEILTIAAP